MAQDNGEYSRQGLYRERVRYKTALLQRSRRGRPIYLTDGDVNDAFRIFQKQQQRFAQLFPNAVVGAAAWRVDEHEDNNFLLKGGNDTDEGAAVAWIGGLRCTLYKDVDYKCIRLGSFNETWPTRSTTSTPRWKLASLPTTTRSTVSTPWSGSPCTSAELATSSFPATPRPRSAS